MQIYENDFQIFYEINLQLNFFNFYDSKTQRLQIL